MTLTPQTLRYTFPVRLRSVRLAAGYTTATAFAKALAVEPATYRRWERGGAEPNLYWLYRIAQTAGCSVDFLITGQDVVSYPPPPLRSLLSCHKGSPRKFLSCFYRALPGLSWPLGRKGYKTNGVLSSGEIEMDASCFGPTRVRGVASSSSAGSG